MMDAIGLRSMTVVDFERRKWGIFVNVPSMADDLDANVLVYEVVRVRKSDEQCVAIEM